MRDRKIVKGNGENRGTKFRRRKERKAKRRQSKGKKMLREMSQKGKFGLKNRKSA